MALILLYNSKNEIKKQKLKNLIRKRGYQFKEATKEDLDQKIGYLVDLEGYEKNNTIKDTEGFDFTFLLIKDVENNQMYEFLEQMQKEDLYIEHKAGLTDTNKDWTLRELLTENDKEHKAMQLVTKINNLINYAKALMKERGPIDNLNATIDEITHYFKNATDFDFEYVNEKYKKLYTLLDKANKELLRD